ncbi:MAG: NAD-dependent epimerase/dehydratase family protein [Acidobacteria bacterium]|nr:NAD-dependent epimerase/dehydratase family protein [Acidobacteriota bacterium]
MKVLITGGAGFIGSHLAEQYIKRGDDVYIIDDLSTGSIDNIAHLQGHAHFHYHLDTVTNQRLTAELVDLCDVVFHLAAAVGVKLIVESPVRTIETNIGGTEVVLQQCAKKQKRVLVASTSEVYGKSKQIPFSEEDDLVMGATNKGRWSYACSKAIDEFLAIAYWKEKRVPTVVVRLFNTVGPKQTGRYGMVIPNFVQQALKGEDLTVYGDGQQSRCFTHVSDVVGALMKLIEHPQAVGEVYNIGSTQEVSILQLAERIKTLADSDSEIKFLSYDKAYEEGFEDMHRRVPNIGKIHQLIGYQPTFTLDEILQSVIAHHRNKLTAQRGTPAPSFKA